MVGVGTTGWEAFMQGLNAAALDMAGGAHALVPAGERPWRDGLRRPGLPCAADGSPVNAGGVAGIVGSAG